MSYKVVYFTRNGNSKRIAEKIASKLSVEVIQITDNKNWKGIIGFIKGGYYSTQNKDVEIEVHGNINYTDELIVVTPVWAARPVPAVRVFLKGKDLSKINLVASSAGGNVVGCEGFKSLTEIIKRTNNEDTAIETLVSRLKA